MMMKILINLPFLFIIPLLSLTAQQEKATVREEFTFITGKLDKNIKSDTLYLILNGQFYNNMPEKGADTILATTADEKGNFRFKVLAKKSPFHVSLFTSSQRDSSHYVLTEISDIKNYLIEPGDSIHVNFEKGKLKFSGKNSALFAAQYAVQQTDPDESKLNEGHTESFLQNPRQWMKQWDYMLKIQLDLLATFKSKINASAYSIIRADILGANRYKIYNVANFFETIFGKQETQYSELNNLLKELEKQPAYIKYYDSSALSPRYIEYLYKKMVIEIKYNRAIGKSTGQKYDYFLDIINKYPECPLRDKLLTRWIQSMVGFNIMQPQFLDNALKVVKTPIYAKKLNEIKFAFSKGAELADFNFRDNKGNIVRLVDFRGKVLMIDMWFTGCGACIAVAKGLPEVEERFKNRKDLAFISISTDRDKKKWLNSIDKDTTGKTYTHFTTGRTVYLNTDGTGSQNEFIKKYALEGFPTLLIIDKSGQIFSSKVSRPIDEKGKTELIAQLNEALNKSSK